jgi:hypothetical protein
MTDLSMPEGTGDSAPSAADKRVAELLRQCAADYESGAQRRQQSHRDDIQPFAVSGLQAGDKPVSRLRARRQAKADRRRHVQLVVAANRAINKAPSSVGPQPATVIALAFAMHAIRLDEAEARDYLNAALAERGYPLLDDEENGQ